MLDVRTIGRYGPDWAVREFLVWDDDSNKIAWSAYVGKGKAGKGSADLSICAAPGRARVEELVGLPRAYIDTCGLDLFRDEKFEICRGSAAGRCRRGVPPIPRRSTRFRELFHAESGREGARQPNQGDRVGLTRVVEEEQWRRQQCSVISWNSLRAAPLIKQTGVTKKGPWSLESSG